MAERAAEGKSILIPIEWYFPENIVSRYATNIIIQHSEHEFNISFFEIWPPLLLGTPEERKTQLEGIEAVRAECVARVIVAAEKMPEFIRVLQENYEKYRTKQKEE